MFFVNGKPQEHTQVTDRSFQYGDGCFTTVLVKNGLPMYWEAHRNRLQTTCQRLAIELPDWQQIEQWVTQAIDQHSPLSTLSGIKIHISRGHGGRGYSCQGLVGSQVTVSSFDYPNHYNDWQQYGIEVGVSQVKLGINPLLAGLKHNNRLEQILVKQDIEHQQNQDAIVLDCQNTVVEMCAANLFWVINGQIYTPDLTLNGVEGVMRAQVLGMQSVVVGHYKLKDVLQADEVFMTNALHAIVPIKKIQNTTFTIGAITRALQEKLNP
ncbi:aminodeoxychorismate lyase [Vibrio gangliei]|uniref:aminodeoxychorismate lyase n=1 Tax=Vibrio gangliei TaxID=2077090 RepID=UPI000D01FE72|nr:aminodeoxychorismate lyase [Vibrio gangliei]